ncbi:hypothetical protein ACFSOZ_38640 [Mesorhizobium newzealandense]|uniref:SEC-C domain-containing protein n=1 Tax=Mesorhizobium newzealandense TaxID=1300302 RepID=A0ABW4UQ04_9HYPH
MVASAGRKLCGCGSGKRRNQCCGGRLPTYRSSRFKFDEPAAIDGVAFHPDGTVSLIESGHIKIPINSFTEELRDSNKGEKKLLSIPTGVDRSFIDQLQAMAIYDNVFAIDTGTKTVNGEEMSLACFVECQRTATSVKIYPMGIFEFRGKVEFPENFGWLLLISLLREKGFIRNKERIAIITDSDAGNHQAYNSRERPYFIGQFLPESVQLVYAFDKSRSIPGIAVKQCDKLTQKFFEIFKNSDFPKPVRIDSSEGPCHAFRLWFLADGTTLSSDTDEANKSFLLNAIAQ